MIQELRVRLHGREGVGWVGLVCFESSGEEHVSFHIIFFGIFIELTPFHMSCRKYIFSFFVNTHLLTYEHNIYMYI